LQMQPILAHVSFFGVERYDHTVNVEGEALIYVLSALLTVLEVLRGCLSYYFGRSRHWCAQMSIRCLLSTSMKSERCSVERTPGIRLSGTTLQDPGICKDPLVVV
jgi:hypothetical protein